MIFPAAFRARLKWTIYEWLGEVSILEVKINQQLVQRIEELAKRLCALNT